MSTHANPTFFYIKCSRGGTPFINLLDLCHFCRCAISVYAPAECMLDMLSPYSNYCSFWFQMCAEQVLCIATCIGSSIGIFFVSIFGLRDCGASDCSFTENIPENMTIAGVILSLLLISAVISMIIVCCSCRSASQFGVSFKQQRRSLVVRGGTQVPLTTRQATNMPIDTASAYKYSSIAVGGATQNTAAEHAPSDDMVLQCEPQTTGQTIQELREQNRHLQEQIRLQQEQMALQQQLRQLAGQAPPTATPIYMPPPPSYEEVTSDESLLRQSEAHDEELKHHIQ